MNDSVGYTVTVKVARKSANFRFVRKYIYIIADAASGPEASEQISSSNSYWVLKVRFYFRFADQNELLLTDQNALLLTDQNALHAWML